MTCAGGFYLGGALRWANHQCKDKWIAWLHNLLFFSAKLKFNFRRTLNYYSRGLSQWVRLDGINAMFSYSIWYDKIRNPGSGILGNPWNDQRRINIIADPVHTCQDVLFFCCCYCCCFFFSLSFCLPPTNEDCIHLDKQIKLALYGHKFSLVKEQVPESWYEHMVKIVPLFWPVVVVSGAGKNLACSKLSVRTDSRR